MKKNEWISVKDSLPKYGQRVLVVCTNLQNKMQKHVSICDYWGSGSDNGLRRARPLWSGWKTVTHWMPLPDIPEE